MITNQVKSFLLNAVFLILGVWAMYLLSDKIDLDLLSWERITGTSILTVLVATFFAYWFRINRWKMLLEFNQGKQKRWQIASSMFYGYFINLALPRAGEVSKSLLYKKYSGLKFPFIIGTVVLERLIDVLMLFLLLLTYSILDAQIFKFFYDEWIVLTPINDFMRVETFIFLGVLGIAALYLFWKFLKPILETKWNNFSEGLFALAHLPNKWKFILFTCGIWIAYFFTSYSCFVMVDTQLGVRAGIALLVLGSVARSIPIQAGAIGVYHFVVVLVLTLPVFGETEQNAILIATLVHGIQTSVQVVMGVISLMVNTIALRKV